MIARKLLTPALKFFKKQSKFSRADEERLVFEKLKQALTKTPVLRCTDIQLPNEVTTDASDTGVGGFFTQEITQ